MTHVNTTAAALLALSLTATSSLTYAGGFGNDSPGCAADRPCFNGSHQEGNTVVFSFTGVTGWDYYNVRYATPGGEKQVENRTGTYTFRDVQPGRRYTLRVQGCNKHVLAPSTCSPWVEDYVDTATPSKPPPSKPPAPAYYRLQLKSGGKYLDAVHCSDQVALNPGSTYAGGACQLWRLVPAGDGWSRLQLKSGGKYLDAANCSDQVALNPGSTYAGGSCQLWRLVPVGDVWSRLQVKQGGKYLDASYCSDKVALSGTSTYAGGGCQLWRLVSE